MVRCGGGLMDQATEAVQSVVQSGSIIMVESMRRCALRLLVG
jgi:hypothetical protein